MDITCPNCAKVLRVPDEKLPASGSFKIKCPSCGNPIAAGRGKQADLGPPATGAEKPSSESKPREPSQGNAGESGGPSPAPPAAETGPVVEPEMFPPGAKVAFVFVRDEPWRAAAETFLGREGFELSGADSPEVAVKKLRLNDYDLLLVQEDDSGAGVLAEVNAWSGLSRRRLNLVLVGEDASSRDPKAAFYKGANLYCALGDAGQADELLQEALAAYEVRYRLLAAAEAGEGEPA